jgi:hypothetical protein
MVIVMNERIKELAEQAYEKTQDEFRQDWDGTPRKVWDRKFQEKFAEFLVRECMELTKQCSTGKGIHDLFADQIIAQHFGVELNDEPTN